MLNQIYIRSFDLIFGFSSSENLLISSLLLISCLLAILVRHIKMRHLEF